MLSSPWIILGRSQGRADDDGRCEEFGNDELATQNYRQTEVHAKGDEEEPIQWGQLLVPGSEDRVEINVIFEGFALDGIIHLDLIL